MKKNQIRIIGGRWRSRRIRFPDVEGLRPTADRIRETLFNWLQNFIQDAVCLDLFSGSGILGFEALSRGAAHVSFVDKNPEVIRFLHVVIEQLQAEHFKILQGNIPSNSLHQQLSGRQYSIVFIDPPFHQGLIESTCAWLASTELLAPGALIYIEAERSLKTLALPENWTIIKSKETGQVGYHLVQSDIP